MWKGKGWYWVWDEDEDDAIITYLIEYNESLFYCYKAMTKTKNGCGCSYENARPLTDAEFKALFIEDSKQMSFNIFNTPD